MSETLQNDGLNTDVLDGGKRKKCEKGFRRDRRKGMMGSHKWHGVAPNAEQLEAALQQLEETLGDY